MVTNEVEKLQREAVELSETLKLKDTGHTLPQRLAMRDRLRDLPAILLDARIRQTEAEIVKHDLAEAALVKPSRATLVVVEKAHAALYAARLVANEAENAHNIAWNRWSNWSSRRDTLANELYVLRYHQDRQFMAEGELDDVSMTEIIRMGSVLQAYPSL